MRQRREAGGPRRGAAGGWRLGARAPDRHLVAGARADRAAPHAACSTSRSSATSRPTRSGCAAPPRRATGDGPMLVLLLGSNIGNFDAPAALDFPAPDPPARCSRATAAARRRSRQAGARTAARVRRSARRDRRVQQEPARADQPRARRAISTWTPSITSPPGTRRSSASRCTSSAESTQTRDDRCGAHDGRRSRRGERIWTESSYKYEPDQIERDGGGDRLRGARPVDRRATRGLRCRLLVTRDQLLTRLREAVRRNHLLHLRSALRRYSCA